MKFLNKIESLKIKLSTGLHELWKFDFFIHIELKIKLKLDPHTSKEMVNFLPKKFFSLLIFSSLQKYKKSKNKA